MHAPPSHLSSPCTASAAEGHVVLTAQLRCCWHAGVAPGEHRPRWATLYCNCIRPYHEATPDALHGGSKAIIAVQMSI